MKNRVSKFIALCTIVCGFILTANAQEAPNVKPATLTTEQKVNMHLSRMKTELNLTPDQEAKIKPLIQSEVTARASGDKQAMKDNHAKVMTEMGKILTPEQMTKYKEMVNKQMEKMHQGGTQPVK